MYESTKQTGKMFSLAWAPDSQHFATGSLDGSIVVWGLETGFGKNTVCYIKGKKYILDLYRLQYQR